MIRALASKIATWAAWRSLRAEALAGLALARGQLKKAAKQEAARFVYRAVARLFQDRRRPVLPASSLPDDPPRGTTTGPG